MAKKETTNVEMPEPFDLRSEDIVADQHSKLKSLFPEVFTEGDKIDFEKLKLTLGEMIDVGKERYGMMWPGKADCFKTIQAPSIATLLPDRGESLDFDSTENLIIEGDNLEVLKLLQKGYLGKVNMIYIDPPYNTGSDFIYPDTYSENLDTYLRFTEQVDREGRKFSTNAESHGRFHSTWINMMYPRLFIAKNLLTEDGLIFISIDDFEYDNLKKICDEIFGEENFVDNIVWKKRYGGGAKEKFLVTLHEYILCYTRNIESLDSLFIPQSREAVERYYTLEDRRGKYRTHPLEATKSMGTRKNLVFPITTPDGTLILPSRQWLWSRDRVEEAIGKDELEFKKGRDGNWTVHTKQYLYDEAGEERQTKAFSIIDNVFSQHGTNEIISLFGDVHVFPFPKPTKLITTLLNLGTDSNSLVLDFFSGSGSTADALFRLNQEDQGNRRFILVQLPEPTEREDFKTIADITKERVRRVAKKLDEAESGTLNLSDEKKQDRGFKVFKLNTSNFTTWNSSVPADEDALAEQMHLHVDHILPGRSQDDLLYELLLKAGFQLTTKIETRRMADKKVYSIADGAMLICLEDKLTPDVIKAMADEKPQRVICLDAGFENNDQLKVNAVQTMKARGVAKFQTV